MQLCNGQIDFCRTLSQAHSWDRLQQTPATLSAGESGYRKWIDERIYFLMHSQQTLCVWNYICNPKLKNKCIHFKCVIAKSDILLSTVSNDKAEKVVMLASMTAFKPVVDLSGWWEKRVWVTYCSVHGLSYGQCDHGSEKINYQEDLFQSIPSTTD